MRSVLCKNGHSYDADKFAVCPECNRLGLYQSEGEETSWLNESYDPNATGYLGDDPQVSESNRDGYNPQTGMAGKSDSSESGANQSDPSHHSQVLKGDTRLVLNPLYNVEKPKKKSKGPIIIAAVVATILVGGGIALAIILGKGSSGSDSDSTNSSEVQAADVSEEKQNDIVTEADPQTFTEVEEKQTTDVSTTEAKVALTGIDVVASKEIYGAGYTQEYAISDGTVIQMRIGESLQMKTSPVPTNAILPDIVWTSSNSDAASVNGDRIVINKEGLVQITGITADGSKISSSFSVEAFHDGWNESGASWFYIDEHGEKVTGWNEIDNRRYFFDDKGIMQMGWIEYEGNTYYCTPIRPKGSMVTGTVVIDGITYVFDENGVLQE